MRCSIAMGWRPSRFVYADYLQGGVFFFCKEGRDGGFGSVRGCEAAESPHGVRISRIY